MFLWIQHNKWERHSVNIKIIIISYQFAGFITQNGKTINFYRDSRGSHFVLIKRARPKHIWRFGAQNALVIIKIKMKLPLSVLSIWMTTVSFRDKYNKFSITQNLITSWGASANLSTLVYNLHKINSLI